MPDIRPNFFLGNGKAVKAAPTPVTMPVIQFLNDPQYRTDFGRWLYDNFEALTDEFKR